MLHRIVRMEFSTETKALFIETFYKKQPLIEAFEGCQSVQLMEDHESEMVLYTSSIWDKNESLQKYRNSAMFAETWKYVKPMFTSKAQAFSLTKFTGDESA